MGLEQEAQLVNRAAAGDREAFNALAGSCRPWVFGLCFRLTEDRTIAEDLTQEALLQAFRGLPQLRQIDHFRPWFSRIAVNVCRMHLRMRLARPAETVGIEQAEASVPTDSEPPFGVEEALSRLNPRSRRMVGLFYHEELSHTEIAEILSLSAAAVKSGLHRAREQLRKEMLLMMSEKQKAKLGVTEAQPWALRTILLVEPDETIREEVGKGLRAAGYEVITLPTGEAALEAVERRRGQMLILDKNCIKPNWVEVLTLLRADRWSRENVPIGVLGDPDNQRDVVLAWQAGAELFLCKPPKEEELVGLVNRIAKEWGKELPPPAEK
jgi:RNA polymerase sigma-70 factor (ECF subfamily)